MKSTSNAAIILAVHLVDIVGHTGHNIALSLLCEIADREAYHLVVERFTQVAQHARTDRHHVEIRHPSRETLEAGHHHQEGTQYKQHIPTAMHGDLTLHPEIEIILNG